MFTRAPMRGLVACTLSAALLLPALAQAGRHGDGHPSPDGKVCRPFRPNHSGQPSLAMPRIHPPKAGVVTWGTETRWNPIRRSTSRPSPVYRRDPYKVEISGYNEGSRVVVKQQEKSAKVELPLCTAAVAPRGLKNPKKWIRKQRSKAWQKAVSQALRFKQAQTIDVTVASHKQAQSQTFSDDLPTHTPMRIEGRDAFNRKYATVHLNAEGLPTTQNRQVNRTQSGRRQTGYANDSGMHMPAYDVKANTNTENFFVTPAYTGKSGGVQAKFLGLAAFPAGSQVTVTNTRLEGQGVANHSVSFTASRSGSGSIAIPGMQNDKLRIQVAFPQVDRQAQAANATWHTRIPKASGRPAIQSRGIRYFSAQLAD